jgi:hypothetical protein
MIDSARWPALNAFMSGQPGIEGVVVQLPLLEGSGRTQKAVPDISMCALAFQYLFRFAIAVGSRAGVCAQNADTSHVIGPLQLPIRSAPGNDATLTSLYSPRRSASRIKSLPLFGCGPFDGGVAGRIELAARKSTVA